MTAVTKKLKATNLPRCPYCHSNIADSAGSLIVCTCSAIYHNECAGSLKECASCQSQLTVNTVTEEDSKKLTSEKLSSFRNVASDHFTNLGTSKNNAKFGPLVAKKIWEDPFFKDAYKLAKANSKGKLWLIGGKLYRNLVSILAHNSHEFKDLVALQGPLDFGADACDFDFLTEKLTWFRHIPKDLYKEVTVEYAYSRSTEMRNPFVKERNNLGRCPRFVSQDFSLDLVSLKKAKGIIENGFPKTLGGYFQAVPLNIQACALDLETEELHLSPAFLNCIATRTISPNHLGQLKNVGERKGITAGELLRKKADSLLLFDSSINTEGGI